MGPSRIFSIVFLVLGLFLLGRDAVAVLNHQPAPQALGSLWYNLNHGSLNFAQAITQRYLLPEIWDPGVVALLRLPAWTLPISFGLLFLVNDIFRRRR